MRDDSRGGALSALQSWRARAKRTNDEHWDSAQEAPPYVSSVAVLRSGLRMQRRAGAVLLLGLLGLVCYQQWSIRGLMQDNRTKEFLVVPGASDFLPIRANMIPDASIVSFARYFTDRMISVSDRSLAGRFDELRRFMVPALEVELEEELRSKASLLRDVKGAEIWSNASTPQISRETRGDGQTYFVARITGSVERYALKHTLGMTREVVTLTFRMRNGLSGDDPWIFEVTDFERRTADEQAEWDKAQGRAQRGASQ